MERLKKPHCSTSWYNAMVAVMCISLCPPGDALRAAQFLQSSGQQNSNRNVVGYETRDSVTV